MKKKNKKKETQEKRDSYFLITKFDYLLMVRIKIKS